MTDIAPQLTRRERLIKRLVFWAVTLLYRSVEVYQRPGLTSRGPQLGVSNHFGGFADPLALIRTMDRVPRFIARDVIWRYPIAKQVMDWVKAIPVHKPDDKGTSRNDQMFGSTYQALGEGDLVVIFPEGITVDDPAIAPIKTGAARIALGARAQGVEGIAIVPAGIHYEDKATLRSKVFVRIGNEIDLDEEIDTYVEPGERADADNRTAVVELTEEIERRLRATAPNFRDWDEQRALTEAARISLRTRLSRRGEVDYGAEQRLAAMLARRPAAEKQNVEDAVTTYEHDLEALGLNDRQFVHGIRSTRDFSWYLVRTLVVAVLLLPFFLIGVAINAVPMLLVWLVGRLRVAPAMMATLKPGAAIVFFLITWGIFVWRGGVVGGAVGAAAVLLLLPVYLFAVIAFVERGSLLVRARRSWRKAPSAAGLRGEIMERRQAVVGAVVDAL